MSIETEVRALVRAEVKSTLAAMLSAGGQTEAKAKAPPVTRATVSAAVKRVRKPKSTTAAPIIGPQGQTWSGRGRRPKWLEVVQAPPAPVEPAPAVDQAAA